MSEIKTKAYAKINLTLDVLEKMDDGYHQMLMVMQSVSLCDDITISMAPGNGKVSAVTNRPYIPGDARNVACKAAAAVMKEMGINDADVKIMINKRIPVCAGMGGGSADAAAVLKTMGTGIPTQRLMEIAAGVGSDVPFCLMGGAALAMGRGERLKKVQGLPNCHIVVCKPGFSISTPRLFAQLDCRKIKKHPDTNGMLFALESEELGEASRRFFNIFEEVLTKRASGVINGIKNVLLGAGALGASMTGTGSAVFGVFDEKKAAEQSYNVLKNEYREVFLTKPV